MTKSNLQFRIAKEVKDALNNAQPVVALESSIIAQGMPFPVNIETALKCEKSIRDHGVTPATIAVIDGEICVGLSQQEIAHLGQKETVTQKLSRRDLGIAVAHGLTGATTVAATMLIAHGAGISIFATGGIGGVHRGGESSMDISADLEELARTPVAVVCSGAKSILDIGRTLEVLETKGVPIIGYQTSDMPAFFTRVSGFHVDCTARDAYDCARILKAHWQITKNTGAVVANPVPADAAMCDDEINSLIDDALIDAARKNIRAKDVTPFLLTHIAEKSGHQSLQANVALVTNNADVAARIAREYSA